MTNIKYEIKEQVFYDFRDQCNNYVCEQIKYQDRRRLIRAMREVDDKVSIQTRDRVIETYETN